MAHRSFGTVKIGDPRDPITFDFGLWSEETFTVIPTPSLGATFDVQDAPEPNPENPGQAARVLSRFIESMLDPADVPRYRQALHRIPADQGHIVVEAAEWILEQLTGFPTPPPTD